MIDNPTNCPPQVRVGDIKAFAAARPAWQNRLAVAPEIPTVEEAGLPGFYLSHWHGLWVAPSWRLWQIQPCVSASPTLARKFLRATSGRRKRSAVCTENSDSNVLVMQAGDQGMRYDASGALNRARDGRILV
jgi:hypothetical protein